MWEEIDFLLTLLSFIGIPVSIFLFWKYIKEQGM